MDLTSGILEVKGLESLLNLSSKCNKIVTITSVTLYATEEIRCKCWWVGGGSNPGPPDLKSYYNGKSQQKTID